jgi:signal transduction histidine kinase
LVLLPRPGTAQTPTVLTTIGQLQALSPEEARTPQPVKVQATVTYTDAEWQMLFVQDSTASAFVSRSAPTADFSLNLHAGETVEIEGVSEHGVTQYNIHATKIRPLGEGKFPQPLDLPAPELFKQIPDTRWVRVVGFIAGIKPDHGNKSELELGVGAGKIIKLIICNESPATATNSIGSVVEVTGVFGYDLDDNYRPTGKYMIWVPDPSRLQKIRPLAVTPISQLADAKNEGLPFNIIRVRGNVVSQRPGEYVVIQDKSGQVRVNYDGPKSFVVGVPLEVYGVPETRAGAAVLNRGLIVPHATETASPADKAPPLPTAADLKLPELVRVSQLRALSEKEAIRGYPVRITGMITYSDPASKNQFIQDESSGIFVHLTKKLDGLPSAGNVVEVTGYSGPGDYAPVIEAEEIRVLGKGILPRPRSVSVQTLMTGSEDSQWVMIYGVVHSQSIQGINTLLNLSAGDTTVQVVLPSPSGDGSSSNLVDALVEVQGVCATVFNDHRRLKALKIFVPGWAQLRVEEAPPQDAFALPLLPVSGLLRFQAAAGGFHRSHLQGTVSLCLNDGAFYIQDATGGVLVQPQMDQPSVRAGDHVDVVAFQAVAKGLPLLQEAIVKQIPGTAPLKAAVLPASTPLSEALHGVLIQTQARVISHSSSVVQEGLTLEFGQWIIDATLQKDGSADQLKQILPGSVVGLTGIYSVRLDATGNAQSFQLLLRSPKDVTLISRPTWWTARRTVWSLGILGLVSVLALAWVSLLRKEVQHQTRQLRLEIEERKRMEVQVEQTHRDLLVASRQAGMAEIATGVLHNVGNVLNSVNVSASLINDQIKRSKAGNLGQLTQLLKQHAANLGAFLSEDPKGRQVLHYLEKLDEHLTEQRLSLLEEVSSLTRNVGHIKDIVAMQQNYACAAGVTETVQAAELVEDSLRVNHAAFERHRVEIVRDYERQLPPMTVDKHKVLQILINLLQNAKYACAESEQPDKRIIVRVCREGDRIRVSVADNGVGIAPENISRIFNQGFTTRKNGHGFGLHSGALAAKEVGGALSAQSDGPGRGATFTLELPLAPETNKSAAPPPEAALPPAAS